MSSKNKFEMFVALLAGLGGRFVPAPAPADSQEEIQRRIDRHHRGGYWKRDMSNYRVVKGTYYRLDKDRSLPGRQRRNLAKAKRREAKARMAAEAQ